MRMFQRLLCLLLLPLPLVATGEQAASRFLDPARLRAFGQNGVELTLYTNTVCEDEAEDEIQISGSLGNVFRSISGELPSSTIGMPDTASLRAHLQRTGLMARPYYHEYALVPDQPVLLQAAIQSANGLRCARELDLAFIPKAGADYEVGLSWGDGLCLLVVKRIGADGIVVPFEGDHVVRDCKASVPRREPSPLLVFLFMPEELQYRLSGNSIEYDSYEDLAEEADGFAEELREGLSQPGARACVVLPAQGADGPLLTRLRAELDARGSQDVLWAAQDAVRTALHVPAGKPLEFPAAAYHCMKEAHHASAAP